MPKILLAEDDKNLGTVIVDNLQMAGYQVTLATNGEQALERFGEDLFDICLLDVMLPKLDGFEVAKRIREQDETVPLLFLTARSMEEDRLEGFKSGGDDYITKPFSMKELIYRIEVFLKRTSKKELLTSFSIGKYTFDYKNLDLYTTNTHYSLTQKEAEVLKYLCENKEVVIKRNDILKAVWGSDDYFLGRSMDVFISKLRKYLKEDPNIKINNIHGVGFKFEVQ